MLEQTPYAHKKHGQIVISDGIGQGSYGSFYIKPNGNLKRLTSIPMVDSVNEAKRLLMEYAQNHKDITTNEL